MDQASPLTVISQDFQTQTSSPDTQTDKILQAKSGLGSSRNRVDQDSREGDEGNPSSLTEPDISSDRAWKQARAGMSVFTPWTYLVQSTEILAASA
jgi:hypothetical protein